MIPIIKRKNVDKSNKNIETSLLIKKGLSKDCFD